MTLYHKVHLNQQEVYEKFIKSATHPKTKKWYTIQSLNASGEIPDSDLEQFEDKEYPFLRLHRLTRVKERDGKEYLERFYTVYAISKETNPIHKSVIDSDYWDKPVVYYQYVTLRTRRIQKESKLE